MSWRSSNPRTGGSSAWRQALAPLRQEANAKGFASSENLKSGIDALKSVEGDALDHELVEDLSFLVQQALGPPPSAGSAHSGQQHKDTSASVALCRLLQSVAGSRSLRLHAPAANLTLGALRRWSDAAFDAAPAAASGADGAGLGVGGAAACGDGQAGASGAVGGAAGAAATAAHSLQLEALGALAALLPENLGALSEHERAAQLAALQSLLVPVALQQRAGASSGRALSDLLEAQCLALTALGGCCAVRAGGAAANSVHSGHGGTSGGAGAPGHGPSSSTCALSSEEVASLIASAASLLQTCASSRTRPVEDGAHSRMYAALLRALTAAVGASAATAAGGGSGPGTAAGGQAGGGGGGAAASEATRQAWLTRAGVIVEGLQRLFTYGVQASLSASASAASGSSTGGPSSAAAAAAPGTRPAEGAAGGGRSYRPPHLRRRESNADGGWSDSDVSDSEHFSTSASTPRGGGGGDAGGAGGATVDRFRSSRVRLAALGCVMAMAKTDPRALQPHWSALLPLQSPLAPRPLTPHLLTALLYDPLVKVRAMAASTIASLVDGPAQRAILAVAEAPPPQRPSAAASRAAKGGAGATVTAAGPPPSGGGASVGFGAAGKGSTGTGNSSGTGSSGITTSIGPLPVRGFLTLSMSLGQLLLGAHAGLLHAVGNEPSTLVLPGVLRALCVMIAATPYERLPPEVLPETVRVLRARWALLSSSSALANGGGGGGGGSSLPASSAVAGGELAPIHAAYLACLAECFSTKQPIAGLAAFLSPQQHQHHHQHHQRSAAAAGTAHVAEAGKGASGGGGGAMQLVSELLMLGQDGSASALLRIEALGALKGLAQHYTFAMPPDVWEAVRATAAVGLSPAAPPASPRAGRPGSGPSGPPSRTSSSSSLGAAAAAGGGGGGSWRSSSQQQRPPGGPPAPTPQPAGGATPEDKAAQLSVKLVSEYLAAVARQYGMSRADAAAAAGAGDADLPAAPPPPPSPGVVPLAAAPARQQLRLQLAGAAGAGALSPVSVASEEERGAGVARLAGMWGEAVTLLVPAATSHSSFMVRSVGLTCLGEVPEPVFSSLPPGLQQHVLALLSAAAAADPVAATRAAACKALGAAAAFPAVLAHAGLSGQVSRALAGCLRDGVLSVRIAASWAVANLCDAHRRRLVDAAAPAGAAAAGRGDERASSHERASTSASPRPQPSPRSKALAAASSPQGGRAGGAGGPAAASAPQVVTAALEPHHYAQIGALCAASITATQDTDKVRANGIRAVGNLLSFITPDMAPGLAAAAAAAGTGPGSGPESNGRGGGGGSPAQAQHRPLSGRVDNGSELRPQGGWSSGRGRGAGGAAGGGFGSSPGAGGRGQPQQPHYPQHHPLPPPAPPAPGSGSGGGAANIAGGVQLDAWLDSALTCLQSSLTTGGMKVQWNACYAVHGLLRNAPLLAHPRVGARLAPLLLLLVMLVRESANFKIRTHAAAALAALPSREGYGDVLADALLVVAAALEGLSNGGGGAAAPPPAQASGKAGGAANGATAAAAEGAGEGGDGDGDGKFPNYRYAAGLAAQLRATLLHLLALSAPADGRRVREALARRADFLHGVMREQLLEAVQPLRAAMAAAAAAAASASGSLDAAAPLPADPFGLSSAGSGPGSAGRGASPRDAAGAWGLAALLDGLSLQGSGLVDLRASPSPSPRKAGGAGGRASATGLSAAAPAAETGAAAAPAAEGMATGAAGGAGGAAAAPAGGEAAALGPSARPGRPLLSVEVSHLGSGLGLAAGGMVDEAQRAAAAKLGSLAAPLRGFEGLLQQLGAGSEAVLRDVQAALARLPPPSVGR